MSYRARRGDITGAEAEGYLRTAVADGRGVVAVAALAPLVEVLDNHVAERDRLRRQRDKAAQWAGVDIAELEAEVQ